jgi:hypothetical protein
MADCWVRIVISEARGGDYTADQSTGIFAGLNVVAFVLVFFFVRETSGATLGPTAGSLTFMSLEELNYVFGVSTKKHAMYQLRSVLPWIWRRYLLRDKTVSDKPPQLYTWASSKRAEKQETNTSEGQFKGTI